MEEALVMYPSPHIGHLISMVELGKLILTHHPSISIHILITTPPYKPGDTAPYIASVSATTPINFHRLPTISLSPSLLASFTHPETLTFEVLRLNKPDVFNALQSISKHFTVQAFVMDFFCGAVSDVPAQLNIPALFFFTSGASVLAAFLYLPTIHRTTQKSFKYLKNTLLHFPGVPPIPSLDMPKPILDRDDEVYQNFLDSSIYLAKSSGIITNTFEYLEPRAVKGVSDGSCVPDSSTPPIYCIGPLVAPSAVDRVPECLTWLDTQPKGSVVFLCFGSLGLFTMEQLKEIAVGLERSGQRFLWVARHPPSQYQNLPISAELEDPALDSLLPEGFLERTKERGLVVKNWAPQAAVLNHVSVGGFVTHCGWNSVLEAVSAGVPMVAWPLYAEQRFNRVLLVEEIKIALRMTESEDGFVNSTEVEKRVSELMASKNGELIRERTLAVKNEAEAALSQGGSGHVALYKLFDSWKRG
ncbi:hypothetical protein FNV43_RR24019 [Rhamnella rubrinervis]|uniref:Glycosyltransferase n=1 Tax=Rhamnella rubrinervis TaxID=2594499 RepID=A0A8K0DKQ5_9ROSA|nr:hypothetical protein FNV43_RR24019 [Rhamnella rubrinervis]